MEQLGGAEGGAGGRARWEAEREKLLCKLSQLQQESEDSQQQLRDIRQDRNLRNSAENQVRTDKKPGLDWCDLV